MYDDNNLLGSRVRIDPTDPARLLIANPWHEPRRQGSPRDFVVRRRVLRVVDGVRFYQATASVLAVDVDGMVLTKCVTVEGALRVLEKRDPIQVPEEMLTDILARTRDGDALGARDLRLVEAAANVGDHATPHLLAAVQDLHTRCAVGYTLPAFHGLDGLTIRESGHVDYKGHNVEHFEQPWAYSAGGKAAAVRLHAKCRRLEASGQAITFQNVMALTEA